MWRINSQIIFVFGFFTGTLISYLLQDGKLSNEKNQSNNEVYLGLSHRRKYISFDSLRYGDHNYVTESDLLFESIQVLCVILVSKDKNFQAIKNTWGRGCNAIQSIYINQTRSIFPSKSNSNANPWLRYCENVKKTQGYYDWFLIVNDDTFVIIDNLRYYLSNKNSSHNYYLGYPVKFWNTNYNLGKAGYVISRGVVNSIKDSTCETGISYRNKLDYLLGSFLKKLNISVTDTKDDFGFSLFHPYNLNRLLFPVDNHKFEAIYEAKCCSRNMITFNAMEADKMYTYHYMLYTLQIFYEGSLGNRPPEKQPDEEVWQTFLKSHNLPLNINNEEYYRAWDKLIDSPDTFGRNMKREDYSDTDK